jgi:hypothetical protein
MRTEETRRCVPSAMFFIEPDPVVLLPLAVLLDVGEDDADVLVDPKPPALVPSC